MFANGAGIAPMRGLLQERFRAMIDSQDSMLLGKSCLFFGVRDRESFIFSGDFETLTRLGGLSTINLAFSRETSMKKQYIQDLIAGASTSILEILSNEKGRIYICGSKAMKEGVFKAIEQVLADSGFDQTLEHMIHQKKVFTEVWG